MFREFEERTVVRQSRDSGPLDDLRNRVFEAWRDYRFDKNSCFANLRLLNQPVSEQTRVNTFFDREATFHIMHELSKSLPVANPSKQVKLSNSVERVASTREERRPPVAGLCTGTAVLKSDM